MSIIVVRVDVREKGLIEQIQKYRTTLSLFHSLYVEIEALPIGDIVLSEKSCPEAVEYSRDLLVLERKTAGDLLASIKDGRYDEQSYRLNGLDIPNHNIIYLIEGEVRGHQASHPFHRLNGGKGGHSPPIDTTLYSAMFSLHYYKGFSVFRSRDLEETAFIICHMAHKIKKEWNRKVPYYALTTTKGGNGAVEDIERKDDTSASVEADLGNDGDDPQGQTIFSTSSYSNVVKKVKKDNITPNNIGEIMLCQIPSVSSITASAIMSQCPTIEILIHKCRENPEWADNLTYTNSKGQVRKIGKNVISNIKTYLHI